MRLCSQVTSCTRATIVQLWLLMRLARREPPSHSSNQCLPRTLQLVVYSICSLKWAQRMWLITANWQEVAGSFLLFAMWPTLDTVNTCTAQNLWAARDSSKVLWSVSMHRFTRTVSRTLNDTFEQLNSSLTAWLKGCGFLHSLSLVYIYTGHQWVYNAASNRGTETLVMLL